MMTSLPNCPKHPRYSGKIRSRVQNCAHCHALWMAAHAAELRPAEVWRAVAPFVRLSEPMPV